MEIFKEKLEPSTKLNKIQRRILSICLILERQNYQDCTDLDEYIFYCAAAVFDLRNYLGDCGLLWFINEDRKCNESNAFHLFPAQKSCLK